jgi:hypothetical protein
MIIKRPFYISQLHTAVKRSPVTALLGPRQCGKTTLARMFGKNKIATFFDLESKSDQQRLQNPELVLGGIDGLIILDEIQIMPGLFSVLRVLADRPKSKTKFLILGSASPDIIKNVSETLAGRIEFVEMTGFDIQETGNKQWQETWLRGGFPRSFLADSDEDSLVWRENFIKTFLERDIPQLGITIPAAAIRRFWTMLSHYHGQIWNASKLGRAMGLSDKTVRSYLDILSGTFMLRQLQPWYENTAKRQVKSPKIYIRDSGILHGLLNLPDMHTLYSHPQIGASWEGFAIEQILNLLRPARAYFWATHNGAEIDLFFNDHGKRFGFEIKFNESPVITKSMKIALNDLQLDHLWVIYPGQHTYPVDEKITVMPISEIFNLKQLHKISL